LGLVDLAAPVLSAGVIIGYLVSAQYRPSATAAAVTEELHHLHENSAVSFLTARPLRSEEESEQLQAGISAFGWMLGSLTSGRWRNLRLAEKIRDLGVWIQAHELRDPVTGVANRRCFLEQLEGELRRVYRYQREVSLAVVQVVGYELIELEFGRELLDALLRAMAQSLTATLRQTDTVGRISGDCLAVLLPETNRIQAHAAMGRVVVAIDDLNASGDFPIEVVAAIGITDTPSEVEEMLTAAIQAAKPALVPA
jgi:diguanylate cyclase (GGDEF)-like protein